jgi:hypothetical protein
MAIWEFLVGICAHQGTGGGTARVEKWTVQTRVQARLKLSSLVQPTELPSTGPGMSNCELMFRTGGDRRIYYPQSGHLFCCHDVMNNNRQTCSPCHEPARYHRAKKTRLERRDSEAAGWHGGPPFPGLGSVELGQVGEINIRLAAPSVWPEPRLEGLGNRRVDDLSNFGCSRRSCSDSTQCFLSLDSGTQKVPSLRSSHCQVIGQRHPVSERALALSFGIQVKSFFARAARLLKSHEVFPFGSCHGVLVLFKSPAGGR